MTLQQLAFIFFGGIGLFFSVSFLITLLSTDTAAYRRNQRFYKHWWSGLVGRVTAGEAAGSAVAQGMYYNKQKKLVGTAARLSSESLDT